MWPRHNRDRRQPGPACCDRHRQIDAQETAGIWRRNMGGATPNPEPWTLFAMSVANEGVMFVSQSHSHFHPPFQLMHASHFAALLRACSGRCNRKRERTGRDEVTRKLWRKQGSCSARYARLRPSSFVQVECKWLATMCIVLIAMHRRPDLCRRNFSGTKTSGTQRNQNETQLRSCPVRRTDHRVRV